MNINEKLMNIQTQLKAPKNQRNLFGKYNYRSCEDILEALKPILASVKATVTLSDVVELIGDRFYIKSTTTLTDTEKGEKIEVSAYAREDETQKGMASAQVTGSVSSYSRKYSLNGMFCIDDTKDSDATNEHGKSAPKQYIAPTNKPPYKAQQPKEESNGVLNDKQIQRLYSIAHAAGIDHPTVLTHILAKFNVKSTTDLSKTQYDTMCKGYENMKKDVK